MQEVKMYKDDSGGIWPTKEEAVEADAVNFIVEVLSRHTSYEEAQIRRRLLFIQELVKKVDPSAYPDFNVCLSIALNIKDDEEK